MYNDNRDDDSEEQFAIAASRADLLLSFLGPMTELQSTKIEALLVAAAKVIVSCPHPIQATEASIRMLEVSVNVLKRAAQLESLTSRRK